MTELLIGIPTFNGHKRIGHLLRSIINRTDSSKVDYKIVVCDDSGSKDNRILTYKAIEEYSSAVHIDLIYNNVNCGVSTSWNHIIRSDTDNCQFIILINDDVIVVEDSISTMLYFIKNNPDVGAVAYELNPLKENEMEKMSSLNNDIIYPIKSPVAWGTYWGFSREKYNTIGGFDENYFAYEEEVDFCTSLSFNGYSCYMLRHPKSFHVNGATTTTFKSNMFLTNSHNYYIRKWGDIWQNVIKNSPNTNAKVKFIHKGIEYEF